VETFDGGITAAEFSIPAWPDAPGYPTGQIIGGFTSDLVIGNLADGFSISWSDPQGAGLGFALIGSWTVTAFNPAWLGPDYLLQVLPHPTSGVLATVDHLYNIVDADGGLFWFNCTDPEACPCLDDTATEDTSWSAVKALF
jgi:hypothetical protein